MIMPFLVYGQNRMTWLSNYSRLLMVNSVINVVHKCALTDSVQEAHAISQVSELELDLAILVFSQNSIACH